MAGDMTVGSLRAILRLDNDQFNRGVDESEGRFRQAGQRMTRIGDRLSGVMLGVGGAMAAAAASTAQHAREVDNFARQAGMGVEQVQRTTMAMERLGVEQDTARDGLRELNLRLGEAATEGGDAAEGFEALDVSMRDANGQIRSSSEVMPEVLRSLQQMDSDAERSAAAAKVFGDEAGFAFAQVASRGGDLQEAMDAVRRSGAVMSKESIAQAREMSQEWDATKQVLMGWMRDAAIPVMSFFTDDLVPVIRDDVVPTVEAMADAWGDLPDPVKTAVTSLVGITAAAGPIMSVSGRLMTMGTRARGALTRIRGLGGYLAGGFGLALAGATAVVAEFVEQQRAVEQATRFLREELQGEEADLASLNDEILVTKLRQQGLLDELENSGITLDQVRRAVTGSEQAMGRLADALGMTHREAGFANNLMGQLTERYEGTLDVLPGLTSSKRDLWQQIRALRDSTRNYNDSLRAEDRLTGQVTTSTQQARTRFEQMKTAVDDAKKAAQQLSTQLDILNGAELSVEQATLRWADQLTSLNTTLSENNATLALNSAEGRENRQAIMDTVQAAQQRVQALVKDGATTDEATAALNRHVRELEREMEQAGFTEEQIQDLIDKYNLTPESVRTAIEADTEPAKREVAQHQDWVSSLPPQTLPVGADTTPARQAVGSLENWILGQGPVGLDVTAQFGAGDGPGLAVPSGGGSARDMAEKAMALTPGAQYITSAHRTWAENVAVGGSPTSYHLDDDNPAIDIGGANLNMLFGVLQRMGGYRELLGPPNDDDHGDHVHVAHMGGMVTQQGIAPLRGDEIMARLQVGEAVLPAPTVAGGDGAAQPTMPAGRNVEVNVYNPRPEPARESLSRELRKLEATGVL